MKEVFRMGTNWREARARRSIDEQAVEEIKKAMREQMESAA